MLRLYDNSFSTYSRRVRIALLEKRIEAELVEVDLFAREQFEPDYLALNPYGRVPTIDDDGFVLYESTAILEYLEATHPEPALVPSSAPDRARMAQHVKLCDIEFAGPAHRFLVPKRFLPEDRWRLDEMARIRDKVGRHLGILEASLVDSEFLVDDQLTLADICYVPFLEFLPLMDVAPPRAVAAWSRRLLDRPSSRETRPPDAPGVN